HDNRHLDGSNYRQDLGKGSVGTHIAENQINARQCQLIACLPGRNWVIHKSAADHLGPLANSLLNLVLVGLQAFFEPGELWPIGGQSYSEYSRICFFLFSSHGLLSSGRDAAVGCSADAAGRISCGLAPA